MTSCESPAQYDPSSTVDGDVSLKLRRNLDISSTQVDSNRIPQTKICAPTDILPPDGIRCMTLRSIILSIDFYEPGHRPYEVLQRGNVDAFEELEASLEHAYQHVQCVYHKSMSSLNTPYFDDTGPQRWDSLEESSPNSFFSDVLDQQLSSQDCQLTTSSSKTSVQTPSDVHRIACSAPMIPLSPFDAATYVSFIDAILRSAITKKPLRMVTSLTLEAENLRMHLSELFPTIFNPGYLQAIASHAQQISSLSSCVADVMEVCDIPLLRSHKEKLAAQGQQIHHEINNSDDSAQPLKEYLRMALKLNFWKLLKRRLYRSEPSRKLPRISPNAQAISIDTRIKREHRTIQRCTNLKPVNNEFLGLETHYESPLHDELILENDCGSGKIFSDSDSILSYLSLNALSMKSTRHLDPDDISDADWALSFPVGFSECPNFGNDLPPQDDVVYEIDSAPHVNRFDWTPIESPKLCDDVGATLDPSLDEAYCHDSGFNWNKHHRPLSPMLLHDQIYTDLANEKTSFDVQYMEPLDLYMHEDIDSPSTGTCDEVSETEAFMGTECDEGPEMLL